MSHIPIDPVAMIVGGLMLAFWLCCIAVVFVAVMKPSPSRPPPRLPIEGPDYKTFARRRPPPYDWQNREKS